MATTITDESQQRIEQAIAPEIDITGVDDHGQAAAQSAMDVLTTQGYFGHVPPESS